MRTRHLLALLAILLIPTAQAGLLSDTAPDVTLRLSGFALGYGAVDTSKTGWVGAGEFTGQITRDGVTSSFLTYCTDIYQSFNWNTTYIYSPVATGSANGFSTRQEDLLGKLYTLAGSSVDDTLKSAAFQLAVWEIVTETSPTLDLLAGNFFLEHTATPAQRDVASGWLQAVSASNAAKAYNAVRLYNANTQDFVVFERAPTPNVVSEPTSLLLAGLALTGMVVAATRRKKKGPGDRVTIARP